MPKMPKSYWMEVLSKAEMALLPWNHAITVEEWEGRQWRVSILFPGDSLPPLRTKVFYLEAFNEVGAKRSARRFLPPAVRRAIKTRSKARSRLYHPEECKEEA